jgi:hypothetical protein
MQQGYASGNSYGNSYQSGKGSSQVGYGMPSPGQRPTEAANEHKSAKKRGLFGAILEWLAR